MSRSKNTTHVIILLLVLAACSPAPEPLDSDIAESRTENRGKPEVQVDHLPIGAIEIVSEPSPAFIYLDGRFVGETSPDGPLSIFEVSREIELRVSCPNWGDGIYRLTVPAKQVLSVKATLTRDPQVWDYPKYPVRIGAGQTLRGAINSVDGSLRPIYYSELVSEPAERVVCLVKGNPTLEVLDPKGKALILEDMPEGIEGAPGNQFYRVRLPSAGLYTIKLDGRAGPYSVRWMTGIPPLSGSDVPHLKKRRLALESYGPDK